MDKKNNYFKWFPCSQSNYIILNIFLFISYLIVITIVLLCNDIHPNPGPLSNNSRCELRNISIVNMNVSSLRNKTELISTELGDHDIICITESRLNIVRDSSAV